MAQFAVQSEDLRQKAAAVQTGAAEVNDTLSRLTSQIADLAGRWQGTTQQAFEARWQEWQAGAKNISQAMEDMGRFLEGAASSYEQTEQQLTQAVGH